MMHLTCLFFSTGEKLSLQLMIRLVLFSVITLLMVIFSSATIRYQQVPLCKPPHKAQVQSATLHYLVLERTLGSVQQKQNMSCFKGPLKTVFLQEVLFAEQDNQSWQTPAAPGEWCHHRGHKTRFKVPMWTMWTTWTMWSTWTMWTTWTRTELVSGGASVSLLCFRWQNSARSSEERRFTEESSWWRDEKWMAEKRFIIRD